MTKNITPNWKYKKIGFIGFGLMGAPMVSNLCATDASIYIWNRSSAAARQLYQRARQAMLARLEQQEIR